MRKDNRNVDSKEESNSSETKPGFWKRQRHKLRIIISSFLFRFIKKINSLDINLTGYSYNPNPNYFEDLAPSKDIKGEKVYAEALAWALRNEEIMNIALTGPYGSGKSSILRSFENQQRQYHYLNISLATFNDNVKDDLEQRKLVETSILQQIFYHVKHEQIPDSRLRRINRLTKTGQWVATVCIVIWLAATVRIFEPTFFQKWKWLKEFDDSHTVRITNLCLIIFIAGAALAIFYCFRFLRNSKLSKMKLAGSEVELARDENSSILNKHLDEILYFFETTPFNVVIIEDLDRFKDPEIFTKLREINNLLNSSKQINRRVVFIYAVKDDMFKDKSRTKFFEFIIPVIPVINSSNSIDILLQKLKSSNLDKSISEDFINDITLYIDDMRMLKNVINEYVIYKDKIGAKLDQDKLLGMMIYKNLYPDDFSALHVNEGKVYGIMAKKDQYIKILADEFDKKIKEKGEFIKNVEMSVIKNILELRSIYISSIIQKLPQNNEYGTVSFDNKKYPFAKLKDDAVFSDLTKSKNLQYYQWGFYNLTTFKQIESEIDPLYNYTKREEMVRFKASTEISKLQNELNELRLQKSALNERSLSEILKTSSTNLIEGIQSDKLLIYLLRYGYIDERYYSYISYFYEGSITKEDNDFILSVKSKEPKPYNYKLTKTEQLIKRLRIAEFELPEILNYDLLDFLLLRQATYSAHLSKLLLQISFEQEHAISFLDGYLNIGKNKSKFIEVISGRWSGFWQFIAMESGYSDEKKDDILKLIIANATVENIIMLNEDAVLSNYISEKKSFLSLFTDTNAPARLKDVLLKLKVKFIDLEYNDASSGLFDYVYQNNLYRINERMTSLMAEKKSGNEDFMVEQLETCHYTTIQATKAEELKKYIEQNLADYINNVFLLMHSNTNESEDSVLTLLNKPIAIELKQSIIQKQAVIIQDINTLPTDVWSSAFIFSRVEPTWPNVLSYYEYFDAMEEPLYQFLNTEKNYLSLSNQALDENVQEPYEKAANFIDSLYGGEGLSDTAYEFLLKATDSVFEDLDFANLSYGKVTTLIKLNKLALNSKHFDLVKARFNPLHLALVESNPKKFIAGLSNYELNTNDYEALLKSDAFDYGEKRAILQTMDDGIIQRENSFTDTIYYLAVQGYTLPEVIMNKLFTIISPTRKIRLMSNQMNGLSAERVTNYLRQIGMPYSMITTNSRPAFEDDELNRSLLDALMNHGYISSYSKQDGKLRVYKKYK